MEYVTTIPECDGEAIIVGRGWIGLVFDGGFVERITADGAGVCADIPGPHGNYYLNIEVGIIIGVRDE